MNTEQAPTGHASTNSVVETWSVPQTLAWIFSKSNDLVALIEQPGTRHVREGHFQGDSLDQLDTPLFATRAANLARGSCDGSLHVSGDEAREGLVEACRSGQLIATGCRNGKGDGEPMSVAAWERITILDASEGRPIRAARVTTPDGVSNSTWWSDLRFPASEVRRLWPDPADDFKLPLETAQGQSLPTEDARALAGPLAAKVRGVVQAISSEGKQLKRSDFGAMVRQLVGHRITAKTIDALWKNSTPEQWRMLGQGSPPEGIMVRDWRPYLPPQ